MKNKQAAASIEPSEATVTNYTDNVKIYNMNWEIDFCYCADWGGGWGFPVIISKGGASFLQHTKSICFAFLPSQTFIFLRFPGLSPFSSVGGRARFPLPARTGIRGIHRKKNGRLMNSRLRICMRVRGGCTRSQWSTSENWLLPSTSSWSTHYSGGLWRGSFSGGTQSCLMSRKFRPGDEAILLCVPFRISWLNISGQIAKHIHIFLSPGVSRPCVCQLKARLPASDCRVFIA